jgi:Heterokaryon incompatibility protein (HET)
MSLLSLQAFRHCHLPQGRYIRLIKVHASAEPASDLVCDLDDADLDSKPEYEALSYAWEGQSPSVPILCNTGSYQGSLLITPNCAAALRQLRHESEQYTIWIDSICIDQTSIDERSIQVALMGDIYKAAKRVVVWLGERDEHVLSAIELLRQISSLDTPMASAENPAPENGKASRAAFLSNARQLTKGI